MAAKDHLSEQLGNSPYILGQRFERLHRMTVDQALSGHWVVVLPYSRR